MHAGEVRAPISSIAALPMNERKVIAHRAMLMIDQPHAIVNLGIGMPEVCCPDTSCLYQLEPFQAVLMLTIWPWRLTLKSST